MTCSYDILFCQVTYCYDEESLKRHIMPENLTTEFGGTLHYNHSHWLYIKTVSNVTIIIITCIACFIIMYMRI